jgi:hypothetical protein
MASARSHSANRDRMSPSSRSRSATASARLPCRSQSRSEATSSMRLLSRPCSLRMSGNSRLVRRLRAWAKHAVLALTWRRTLDVDWPQDDLAESVVCGRCARHTDLFPGQAVELEAQHQPLGEAPMVRMRHAASLRIGTTFDGSPSTRRHTANNSCTAMNGPLDLSTRPASNSRSRMCRYAST